MSMHEFEDLVEEAVRVLAASDQRDQVDLRSMFWQLYDFQNHWDTGFTHFRVMDLLLQYRFVYRFDLQQNPDYEQYREFFEGIKDEDFTFIHVKPLEPHGASFFDPHRGWQLPNPVAGYYRPPHLYFDAGSPMWKRFVEAGLLTGKDAFPPDEHVTFIDTAKAVVEAAEKQNNLPFMAACYSLFSVQIMSFTDDLDTLLGKVSLEAMLASIRRANAVEKALEQQPIMQYGFMFPPLVEDIPAYITFLRQMKQSMSDPNL